MSSFSFKSKFITIEGSEGVGKSTQIQRIADKIIATGCSVLVTREPGGTKLGEKIRELVLYDSEPVTPMAELLLIFAARAQHLQQVVKPALASGVCVISDRYIDSSFAYQGGGRGLAFNNIEQLVNLIDAPLPDCTILLDTNNLEMSLTRAKAASVDHLNDKIEAQKLNFFENVRQAYLQRAFENSYIHIVSSNDTVDNVTAKIFKVLDDYAATA
jgi:dTMP kinase